MADNTIINAPTNPGQSIATKSIGGINHEQVLLEFSDGAGGATEVSAANPLPVNATIDTSTLATSANQSTEIASLAAILAKLTSDPATQTTLAAILAKIIASPATEATLAALSAKITNPLPVSGTVTVDTSLLATSAKQDTGNTSLASILAKIIAAPSTEAKQDTIITALGLLLTVSDFDTKTGSLTETAPATDTASSGLNGRLQRIAQRLTSLIALLPTALGAGGGLKIDGSGTALPISGTVAVTGAGDASASNQTLQITQETSINTVLGLIADAAVAAGATGSISAKLRAISRDLVANIVLAAGANIIGKVGIDQTTPGTTNGVQVNAALPAGSNVIGHVIVDAGGAVIGHVIVDSGTITAVTAITNALPAGTNLLGKVGIDQTTPGTTNAVAATLNAETTKVIGVIRTSDGAGNLLTSNSSTYSAKFALDGNLLGTLGTAFSTAGKVDIKSTQKPSYGATVSMTITNLSALASSATAGWQSARVSNLATLATDYEINVKLSMANTSPANDKAVYVFICPFYTSDAGTTWFASSQGTTTLPTGTEGTTTIASPHNLRLLGVLNYTTANMTLQDTFLLSNCFGNRLPDAFSIIIINFTGAAVATTSGTNNIVQYSPLNDIFS